MDSQVVGMGLATSPDPYFAAWPECDYTRADVNKDGSVNVFDIDPFVLLLTGN